MTCALAGFAAGCGDDDGEDAPTKADYIKQGDGICRAANRGLDRAEEDFFREGGDATAARIVEFTTETVLPNVQGQIDDLRGLRAPEGDEETVTAIYDAADEGLVKLEQSPEQLAQDDPPAFREANRLARDYGFKVCGE